MNINAIMRCRRPPRIFTEITKQLSRYPAIRSAGCFISTGRHVRSTVKMQFEDFDNEESVKCNCQLLQTVQNLVDKYRNVITTKSSWQIEEQYEDLSAQPSTCGPTNSSAMLKALPSPEFALSEVSSPLSVHVQNCQSIDSTNSAIHGECQSVERFVEESSLAYPSPAQLMHSPVRIVRIPNRMCPVHSRIDQHYFNSTGSALQLNYDTISVTNCWQGLKITSPSNASASGSSMKMGPLTSTVSSLWFNNARISFCKFLEPFWSYVS